jgi:hypothetical protein
VDELYEDLLQDYCINGQAVDWAESVWNVRLKDFFSAMRAADLGSNQIAAYVEKRRKRRPLRPRSIANLRCCAGPSPLGVIHSSFLVAPDQGNEEVASKDRKPS